MGGESLFASLLARYRPMTPLEMLIYLGRATAGFVAGVAFGYWVWA
jgi:hypothetical protein